MKNFDWNKFNDINYKIVVHCKTKKEAEDFCKQAIKNSKNYTESLLKENIACFDVFKENTCYSYSGFDSKENYIKLNNTIIEWSKYMNKKFKKSDLEDDMIIEERTGISLKDGMIIEERNGTRRIVLNNVLMGIDDFTLIDQIHEDLTDLLNKENDIVKVYQLKELSIMNSCDLTSLLKKVNFNSNPFLDLIWEREERIELTIEEIEKKLGYKIKIVEN